MLGNRDLGLAHLDLLVTKIARGFCWDLLVSWASGHTVRWGIHSSTHVLGNLRGRCLQQRVSSDQL